MEEAEEQSEEIEPITDRTDLLILVNAKKMGLSFEELNQFIFEDYIKFMNIYVGRKRESSKGTIRNATQGDINKFFA